MTDLSKYPELTNITFDNENAGLAVCHVSQGYGANGRPDALLFKSNGSPITSEITKALKAVYTKGEILKMTNNNKRTLLETLLLEKLKISFPEDKDIYTWVNDFSEDMVAFRYNDTTWAVDYKTDEDGSLVLGEIPRQVFRKEIYVELESGEELIKASQFNKLVLSSDEVVKSTEEETLKMEKVEVVAAVDTPKVGDLLKSAEAQEMLKAMAQDMAKAQFAELQKAAEQEELVKSTTELVKGFTGVVEEDVEGIVKGLVDMNQDVAGTLLKSMNLMQEALVQKDAAMQEMVVQKDAEIEEVKKEFGTKQTAVEAQVEVVAKSGNRTQELASVVNKLKNK